MTTGFITSGFSLVGQMNLQNDGGVIGPDNTPVVNDKVTSFTSPGTFSGADPKNSGQTGKVILIGGGGGGAHQAGGGGAGAAGNGGNPGGPSRRRWRSWRSCCYR